MVEPADEDVQTIWGLSWMAVRSEDRSAVAAAIGLRDSRECSTPSGFEETGRDGRTCFVAPAVDGWTLVVAEDIAFDSALIDELSRTIGEAQAFFADPKRDCYVWRRSRAGKTVRDVAVTPEETTSLGESAPPEPSPLASWKDADDRDVLRVASAWSVDPNRVLSSSALGVIGIRPGAPPSSPKKPGKRKPPHWPALAIMLLFVLLVVLVGLLGHRG